MDEKTARAWQVSVFVNYLMKKAFETKSFVSNGYFIVYSGVLRLNSRRA